MCKSLLREVQYEVTVPTIRDRVVQMAMVLVLGPIFEADLPPEQYAYRPDRNAHDAIRQVHSLLTTGHTQVVDADLAAYLERASHYPRSVGCASKRSGRAAGRLILKPFLRPQLMWTA